jgi:hypothetical protein
MAGLDPIKFLMSDDETERSLMSAIGRAATAMRQQEGENLVVQLTNNISRMFSA